MMPVMTNKLTRIESAPIEKPEANLLLAKVLNHFADSTLRTMRRNLSIIIDLATNKPKTSRKLTPIELDAKLQSFDLSRVDRDFVLTVFRRAQNREYSASTINSLLVLCRVIAEERLAMRQIDAEEYQFICKVGRKRKGRNERERERKTIIQEELIAIMQACLSDEKTLLGQRDYTMIVTALGAGLRAQELVTLNVKNLHFEENLIRFKGKGRNDRQVVPVKGTMEALKNWIEARPPVGGVLFPAFSPHGDKPIQGREDQPMSYQAFYDVMFNRAKLANVSRPTPHQLRHTFATNTYLATEDMYALQMQMGHQNQATTQRYVDALAKEKAQRNAGDSWAIPGVKNTKPE